jgi:hypothetical protein
MNSSMLFNHGWVGLHRLMAGYGLKPYIPADYDEAYAIFGGHERESSIADDQGMKLEWEHDMKRGIDHFHSGNIHFRRVTFGE